MAYRRDDGYRAGMDMMNLDVMLRTGCATEVFVNRTQYRKIIRNLRNHLINLETIVSQKSNQHRLAEIVQAAEIEQVFEGG